MIRAPQPYDPATAPPWSEPPERFPTGDAMEFVAARLGLPGPGSDPNMQDWEWVHSSVDDLNAYLDLYREAKDRDVRFLLMAMALDASNELDPPGSDACFQTLLGWIEADFDGFRYLVWYFASWGETLENSWVVAPYMRALAVRMAPRCLLPAVPHAKNEELMRGFVNKRITRCECYEMALFGGDDMPLVWRTNALPFVQCVAINLELTNGLQAQLTSRDNGVGWSLWLEFGERRSSPSDPSPSNDANTRRHADGRLSEDRPPNADGHSIYRIAPEADLVLGEVTTLSIQHDAEGGVAVLYLVVDGRTVAFAAGEVYEDWPLPDGTIPLNVHAGNESVLVFPQAATGEVERAFGRYVVPVPPPMSADG